jgi:ATP-dependent DNA helicase RecG
LWPVFLRDLNLPGDTTLKRIQPHRLTALVLEDLRPYRNSAIGDIRQRIGEEINPKQVNRAIDQLVESGEVSFEGSKRWRKYTAVQ